MSDQLPIADAPACRHLRSKGMFVTGTMNPAEDDPYQMGDGYCWCNHTQGIIGPDDDLVDRTGCNSGRTCYESIL